MACLRVPTKKGACTNESIRLYLEQGPPVDVRIKRMTLRNLFVDMNSYFAAVEQQDKPELRGRPVAVIPTDAETTFCIAASYEAKEFGVRTGTVVWEARKLCPSLKCIIADHKRYVTMHNRIVEAVGTVVPVHQVLSIDEMTCRLIGDERRADRALEIAGRIKAAIRERAGDYLKCSIGIAPNTMLAKVAADVMKPDGLTVFAGSDLPQALHALKLQDFPGIGPRMTRRLNLHGVFAVSQLCAMSERGMAQVWGSKVLGSRWYRLLRGEDVPEYQSRRQTVSHSHVLPPPLRTETGSYGVLVRLTHKAAARLRKIGYWAGAVSVSVGFLNDESRASSGWRKWGWSEWCHIPHCQDTPNILRAIESLWKRRPEGEPFQVGMALSDLRPARSATPSLFEDDRKAAYLSNAMDDVNAEFGASVVHFGAMHGLEDAAPNRIAFTQIPDFDRRVS
jgi:DNA polymerase IV